MSIWLLSINYNMNYSPTIPAAPQFESIINWISLQARDNILYSLPLATVEWFPTEQSLLCLPNVI